MALFSLSRFLVICHYEIPPRVHIKMEQFLKIQKLLHFLVNQSSKYPVGVFAFSKVIAIKASQ